jgi:hypothetical protein
MWLQSMNYSYLEQLSLSSFVAMAAADVKMPASSDLFE